MNATGDDVAALKEWRLRRFLSLRGLARRAGVSTDALMRAERGKRVHDLTARKIAFALGIEVNQVAEFCKPERG